MSRRWKTVILGLGSMGSHHLRIVSQLQGCFEVVGIFDPKEEVLQSLRLQYGVRAFTSAEEAFQHAEVALIATPTSMHFSLAMQAIDAGCHVFIEKPIAATVAQAEKLVTLAQQRKIKIGVGHTERFNPLVVWLLERLSHETILSINIERVGPRPPRVKDVGIITDLAVHDLDLISYLSQSPLEQVRCVGNRTCGEHEDVAQIVVSTSNHVVGSINTNWLTPFKSRKLHIATSGAFFVGDLLRGQAKVYVGDPSDLNRYNVEAPYIPHCEPLLSQAKAFCKMLEGERGSGTVTGEEATQVLYWVECCLKDLREPSEFSGAIMVGGKE